MATDDPIRISIGYTLYIFQSLSALAHILVTCITTFTIAKMVRSSVMPWMGTFFLMSHLSWMHWERMQTTSDLSGSFAVHISSPQMALVIRLMTFCWNIHDGRQSQSPLTTSQKQMSKEAFPPFLEYLSYALFFPTQFTNINFTFDEYRRFMQNPAFELSLKSLYQLRCQKGSGGQLLRSCVGAAQRKLLAGFCWFSVQALLPTAFDLEYLLGAEFASSRFAYKLFIIHMVAFKFRTKFYGIWSIVEGACILSGFGFNGRDSRTGAALWNRLENIRPHEVEFAQNSHAYVGGWNVRTSKWLRDYVYLRISPRGTKPGPYASLGTFIFSAVWHGFYPGYYLTFCLAGSIHVIGQGKCEIFIRQKIIQSLTSSSPTSPISTLRSREIQETQSR